MRLPAYRWPLEEERTSTQAVAAHRARRACCGHAQLQRADAQHPVVTAGSVLSVASSLDFCKIHFHRQMMQLRLSVACIVANEVVVAAKLTGLSLCTQEIRSLAKTLAAAEQKRHAPANIRTRRWMKCRRYLGVQACGWLQHQ